MHWMILSIFSSLIIANMLRFSKNRDIPFIPVMTFNYLIAAASSWFLHLSTESATQYSIEITLGLINSVFYVSGFLLYFESVRHVGISISVSAMRLSVAIPVTAGLIFFNEALTVFRIAGLLLMCFSILSMSRFTKSETRSSVSIYLIMLFLVIGCSSLIDKCYDISGRNGKNLYLAVIFTSAFLLTFALAFIRKTGFPKSSMLIGLLLGIPNQASSFFLLLSLDCIESIVVFPTISISILAGSMISDRVIWGDSLSRGKLIVLFLAAASIVLLNL